MILKILPAFSGFNKDFQRFKDFRSIYHISLAFSRFSRNSRYLPEFYLNFKDFFDVFAIFQDF